MTSTTIIMIIASGRDRLDRLAAKEGRFVEPLNICDFLSVPYKFRKCKAGLSVARAGGRGGLHGWPAAGPGATAGLQIGDIVPCLADVLTAIAAGIRRA